ALLRRGTELVDHNPECGRGNQTSSVVSSDLDDIDLPRVDPEGLGQCHGATSRRRAGACQFVGREITTGLPVDAPNNSRTYAAPCIREPYGDPHRVASALGSLLQMLDLRRGAGIEDLHEVESGSLVPEFSFEVALESLLDQVRTVKMVVKLLRGID